jgi:alkanesulfonate monooxygenase SsuD/methylene tetrahydromethanopterin reductase-like flavin-dependent oxidoreductase (luciferase family)
MRLGFVLPMGEDTRPGVPASTPEIVALAQHLEAAGFDSLWTYDHLLTVDEGAEPAGTWECWTVLAALAVATTRATLGTLVTCTGFREPGLLAKMAHTVHDISGGRLMLGVGAGWHEPEYRAFGYPFDHRVDRFEEALSIITALLRDGYSDFSGAYYTTSKCPLLPATPGRPAPPILVGGRKPRMMALTARHADAYNTAWHALPATRFAQDMAALTLACDEVGRDPAEICVTVGVMVKGDDAPADAPGLACSAEAVAEALAAWSDTGTAAEVLFYLDPATPVRVARLIEGVDAWRAGR